MPSQSYIVFYRRWLAACPSFDLLGLFAVDFMVALFLILSIANFLWLPSFLFLPLLILGFLSKDASAFFLCLLMLLKSPFSITDRHFVTDGLWNCEKCVFTKVIQWIRWSSDLLMFYLYFTYIVVQFCWFCLQTQSMPYKMNGTSPLTPSISIFHKSV